MTTSSDASERVWTDQLKESAHQVNEFSREARVLSLMLVTHCVVRFLQHNSTCSCRSPLCP